jgi:hypothetical protein
LLKRLEVPGHHAATSRWRRISSIAGSGHDRKGGALCHFGQTVEAIAVHRGHFETLCNEILLQVTGGAP